MVETFYIRLDLFAARMSAKFHAVRHKHYGHDDVIDMEPGEYVNLGSMRDRLVGEYEEWMASCHLSPEEEMDELIDVANAAFLRYWQIQDILDSRVRGRLSE